MPGPLPDPSSIRRNAPTIPTTALPLSGRPGDAPAVPSWITLGKHGLAFWLWAWSTPQATAWGVDVGMEAVVGRRASLEDALVIAEQAGQLPLVREMREMDDRLGLTPKGMAALRWKIVDDTPPEPPAAAAGVTNIADRRARLTDAA